MIVHGVQKIYKEILVISNKIKQDQKDNEVAAKWKMAAMVTVCMCSVILTSSSGDGPTVPGGVRSLHHNPLHGDIHISPQSHSLLTKIV